MEMAVGIDVWSYDCEIRTPSFLQREVRYTTSSSGLSFTMEFIVFLRRLINNSLY